MKQKTISKVILLAFAFFIIPIYMGKPLIVQNIPAITRSSSGENYDCVDAWIIIGGDKPSHCSFGIDSFVLQSGYMIE